VRIIYYYTTWPVVVSLNHLAFHEPVAVCQI
jgi:hypothetical protein